MIKAMRAEPSGHCACVSATDSATRLHTCRRIPGRDPILLAAMEQQSDSSPQNPRGFALP
jgi:hypothetical protein